MTNKLFVFIIILFFIAVLFTAYHLFIQKELPKDINQNPPLDNQQIKCLDCNIILISVDTLRADHVGTYGYLKPTTPNIDKFANQAYVFENAYASSPWTLPSHTSMLTGFYPQKFHAELPTDILPENALTIAEILSENGYKTVAFSTGAFITRNQGFAQGFATFNELQNWQDAQEISQKSINWLNQNQKSKFFLFIHSFHTHDPYSPQDQFIKKIDSDYQGYLNSINISQIVDINTSKTNLSEYEKRRIVSLYDAEIAELDNYFGQFFKTLEDLKLMENTIIIITSDHGEEFGEHGGFAIHSYSLYDELLRIPLIIKIGDQLNHKRIQNLVSLVDIVPTILNIINPKSPILSDGQSLVGTFNNEFNNKAVYSETASSKQYMLQVIEEGENKIVKGTFQPKTRDNTQILPKAKMVRENNYKLISNFNGSLELYDLANDPNESNNLINSLPQIKENLIKKINSY